MFGSLFRRAQATVDNAIGQIVNRAIVAIPFLVAAGFGTAAIAMRLNRELGPETASLVLAGAFAVLGILTAIVVFSRQERSTVASEKPGGEATNSETMAGADPVMADVDRELLMTALTTAAPFAIPGLLRTLGRNLPLVAAVAAAVFLIARDKPDHRVEVGEGALEPGE